MKTKTTKKKVAKAPVMANHQEPEITININVIDEAIQEAIGTLMAAQSLIAILVEALEEKK